MNIPCLKNKCILLPACKFKSNIKCDNIIKYFQDYYPLKTGNIVSEIKEDKRFIERFEQLLEVLPNIKRLNISDTSWTNLYEFYKMTLVSKKRKEMELNMKIVNYYTHLELEKIEKYTKKLDKYMSRYLLR